MSNRRSVILTMAAGYDRPALEPFVGSIARFSPNTKLVVFVDRYRKDVIQLLKESEVEHEFCLNGGMIRSFGSLIRSRYRIARILGIVATIGNTQGIWRNLCAQLLFHAAVYRHLAYLSWLRRQNEETVVYLLDSRDVLVLRDLSRIELEMLCVAEEKGTIGSEPMNSAWQILSGYSPAQAHTLYGQKILCSGAMAGPSKEILEFSKDFVVEALSKIDSVCNLAAMDQPIANWMLRNSPWQERAQKLPYQNDLIVNLGTSGSECANWLGVPTETSEGWPAILHQYDRIPSIESRLQNSGLIQY